MDILPIMLINNAILVIIAWLFLRVLMGKLPEITDFLRETIKNDLETWLNSETGQKALYSIGGLIGHGATAGAGIQKTGGKFKWENVLGELASSWIQKTFVKPDSVSGGVSKITHIPEKTDLKPA